MGHSLRFAWVVVGLLVPVALLNYLDRQLLASMMTSVMADIPDIETRENWGFMLGQFKWVYAIFSPFGGLLADRLSRRWVISGSLFLWSAVTFWTGHVSTYHELLWARSCMGISEAFYIPAALALIADYHTGTTRSRAVGFHQMGIYCGVIAGGFGGYVADEPTLGWRWAFTACGIIGMVYAIPLAVILRDVSMQKSNYNDEERTSVVLGLFLNLSFLLLVFYFTLPALAGWVVRDWMPDILKEKFHLGQGKAGVTATIYWQSAAIIGVLCGGYAADRWMQVNSRGRIYVSAIGMACLVPAIFGVGNAASLGIAIGFLILFGFGWGLFDCNNMPILSQIARSEHRATGYGIMNFVSISCGGLADWGFGYLRDHGWPLNIIFSLFAGAATISIVLVLCIRPNPALVGHDST